MLLSCCENWRDFELVMLMRCDSWYAGFLVSFAQALVAAALYCHPSFSMMFSLAWEWKCGTTKALLSGVCAKLERE